MANFKWTVDPIQMPVFRRSRGASAPRSETAQSVATSQEARAAGIKEIERLIAMGAKDAALHKTVEVYGIDCSAAKSFRYDPNERAHGNTDKSRLVTIGDGAFRSVPWLAAVLAHELEGHAPQYKEGRAYESRIGYRICELEAQDHVLAGAARFGLSEADVEEMQVVRQDLWDLLPPTYQSRVAQGDYRLEPGEDKRLPGWEDRPEEQQ